jgi:hypothetical protein
MSSSGYTPAATSSGRSARMESRASSSQSPAAGGADLKRRKS